MTDRKFSFQPKMACLFVLMGMMFSQFIGTKDVGIGIPVFIGLVASGRSLRVKIFWCACFIFVSGLYLLSYGTINTIEYNLFLLSSFAIVCSSILLKGNTYNRDDIKQSSLLILPSLSSVAAIGAIVSKDYASMFYDLPYGLLFIKCVIFALMYAALMFGIIISLLPVWLFFTSGNDNRKFLLSLALPVLSISMTLITAWFFSMDYTKEELYNEFVIIPIAFFSYLNSSSLIFLFAQTTGLLSFYNRKKGE